MVTWGQRGASPASRPSTCSGSVSMGSKGGFGNERGRGGGRNSPCQLGLHPQSSGPLHRLLTAPTPPPPRASSTRQPQSRDLAGEGGSPSRPVLCPSQLVPWYVSQVCPRSGPGTHPSCQGYYSNLLTIHPPYAPLEHAFKNPSPVRSLSGLQSPQPGPFPPSLPQPDTLPASLLKLSFLLEPPYPSTLPANPFLLVFLLV